ncbi:thioredoxin family protein [Porticoccaceae bacterium LTM1]|nr:thioredoxin family protein [Porticoccaceae bacterium LTM1]
MKKPLLLAFALLGLTACGDAVVATDNTVVDDQHEAVTEVVGIDFFHGEWDEALAKAQAENKKLFVDVYTEWCGPCKIMAATVFPQQSVGEYFNERFISIKLDAEDEDINGPELSDRYEVHAYPTYLFLNADGSEISRAVGGMEAEQFVSLAGQILGEHGGNFDELVARYEAGERSVEFVRQYLNGAQLQFSLINDRQKSYELFKSMKQVAEEYVASRGKENLINEEDFSIISSYWDKTPRGDEMAEFVIDNYDAFVAVAPEVAVVEFVLSSNWFGALNAAQAGDPVYKEYVADYDGKLAKAVAYRNAHDKSDLTDIERSKRVYHQMYLEATKNWAELHRVIEQGLQANPSAKGYIRAAGTLSKAEDSKYQGIVREYARKGYEMGLDNAFDLMTYVGILKQDGKTKEAEQVIDVYRNSLGDSAADKRNRELLDRFTQTPANTAQGS